MVSTGGIAEVRATSDAVAAEIERAVVGKRDAVELVVTALLADGHVLIEDFPGLAKTLLARSLATVSGLTFSRIQFTPDLMPSDVTGYFLYDVGSREPTLRRGPVFANVVLADEINRAPAKTQAALLEAMQERQVTIEGHTEALQAPFLVVATQNPIEFEGTYALPEAQLDRFLIRTALGYPDPQTEADILLRRALRGQEEVELRPVADRTGLLAARQSVEAVHVDRSVARYMAEIVAATRRDSRVLVGASPRGSLALMKLSRARAAMRARDFVTPQDVKDIAVPALSHRLSLKPELWVKGIRAEDVVAGCLASVTVPVGLDQGAV